MVKGVLESIFLLKEQCMSTAGSLNSFKINNIDEVLILRRADGAQGATGLLWILGETEDLKTTFDTFERDFKVPRWQLDQLLGIENKEVFFVQTSKQPLWVVKPVTKLGFATQPYLAPSRYARMRDLMGEVANQIDSYNVKNIEVTFKNLASDEKVGVALGLELAHYEFMKRPEDQKKLLPPVVNFGADTEGEVAYAKTKAAAVNLARHLVNIPPNVLYPESYAAMINEIFQDLPNMEVTIWDEERIARERMNLLLAVGRGAEHAPRFVQLKYRPPGAQGKPLALVGKGITFDSGGLDLKPSSFMRLMKKDMGGSACLVGVAYWAAKSGYGKSLDFYLPMAENSVDSKSFRPSDVMTARNGKSVEIDNTDAEGRLILADAFCLAAESNPELIIDVATLTGVVKSALGTEIGGLFSNHDSLANALLEAGQRQGDLLWRLPLFKPYEDGLRTVFADVNHSSTSRYGSGITAALFLQGFIGEIPWAHLDIMAWSDGKGAIRKAGGNGQSVQCLIEFLETRARG
jgi:leucyl aminopeptidase